MNDISTRLIRNSKIDAYLLQLQELTGRLVTESELSSVGEVEKIKAGTETLTSQEKTVLELKLSDLYGRRFSDYINRLRDANPGAVYIWLHATNSCGVLSVPSIADINFTFDHEKIPEGVIVLLAVDFSGRALLDFDADAVEIEVQGDSWSDVKF